MRKFSYFKLLYALAFLLVGVACEKSPEEPKEPAEKVYIEPFELKVAEDCASVDVIYDEKAELYNYAVAAFAKEEFEALDGEVASFAAIIKAATKQGADLKEVDNKFVFSGSASVDLAAWSLEYEKDYVVAAVAYDAKLERTSKIASAEFTTPVEPIPESDFLSVIASDATASSFIVNVKVGAYDGNYTIIPSTLDEIESYGGAEEYAKVFLENDIMSYATDYSTVDDMYVLSGDVTYNMEDGWNLSSGVEFVALVFGVEGDGTYGDIVTEVMVSNPIETLASSGGGGSEGGSETYPDDIVLSDAEFGDIEVSNIAQSSFDYSVTPADDEMPYLIFMFTDDEYNKSYPSDEARISVIYDTYLQVAGMYGYSFSEFVAGSSLPGAYAGSYEDLEAESDYYVVAFGLDLATYQPVSKVEVEHVTTLAPPAITESLSSIAVSDVTFEDATVSVDAGTYAEYYHIYPIAAAMLEDEDLTVGYGGDYTTAFSDAVDYLINQGYQFDPSLEVASMYYFTGSQDLHLIDMVWMVAPETDYYILAAGVDSQGNLLTDVLKSEKFTTGVAPEFSLEIEVSDITNTNAVVSFTPNIKSAYYYNDIYLQSEVDAGLTAEDIIAENPYSMAYYISYGDLVYDPEFVDLKQGTNYCVVAFGYDSESGEATSELFTKSFKTTGEALPELQMPTEVTIPDVEFGEITQSELGDTFITYTVTPSASVTKYVQFYLKAEEYDALGSDEAVILSDFARYQYDVDKGWEDDYRSSMSYYLKEGEQTRSESWLVSSTEYVVYAYGMDEITGLPTTKIKTLRFTTKEWEGDSAPQAAPARERVAHTALNRESMAQSAARFSSLLSPSLEASTQMNISVEKAANTTLRIANRYEKRAISLYSKIK